MIAFIIFGTRALFYSERSITYLEAKFNSEHDEWLLRFKDKSLEEIQKSALLMTNTVGYICYIIVFIILIITYILLAITMTYGLINSITTLINLGILMLS